MAKLIKIPKNIDRDIFVPCKEISNAFMLVCINYAEEQTAVLHTVVRQEDPHLVMGKLIVGESDVAGFVVRAESAINLSTGLLIPSPVWLAGENRVIKPDETRIVVRTDDIVVVSAVGKFSIVTGTSVSDSLHSFLTMI